MKNSIWETLDKLVLTSIPEDAITCAKASEHWNLERSATNIRLKKLVEKGVLSKHGKASKGFYYLPVTSTKK